MKTKLYYFTGTGNSLKVARDLYRAMGGGTDLVPIARAVNAGADMTADRIGIVFPVYAWGPPRIVTRFVGNFKPAADKYVFAVATCGGAASATLDILDGQLRARGHKLSSGFVIRMPGNYTPLYGAPPEAAQKKNFEDQERRTQEMAAVVREGRKTPFFRGIWPLGYLGKFVYRISSPHWADADKKFWADEKCNHCAVCEKVCPVRNITMADGKPTWQHRCEQCLACLQWCPQQAVQFGKKTSGRKRYRHPAVTVGDLMAQRP